MVYKKIAASKHTHRLKSAFVKTAGMLMRANESPDVSLGALFADVQKNNLYKDSKTFVDLVPNGRSRAIKAEYELARNDPEFDLHEFIHRHFYEFAPHKDRDVFFADSNRPVREHIQALWDELERRNRKNRGSLIALPHSYIVPGGRFSEQFYWDSYFIMLGLAADNRWGMIENMMKNYAYMIRRYGFIPTANRSYFLSRSQPPFYALMVQLLAQKRKKSLVYAEHLPYLLAEYRFWMKGRIKLQKTEHKSYARVVEPREGVYLNRYYDSLATPRPESLREDEETAIRSLRDEKDRVYLHLRAGAESGWDFSSRWFLNADDITTIHTADIIPVDLNCLLYTLENTIAEAYKLLKNPLLARKFEKLASKRIEAIHQFCWNDDAQFFTDFNFHHDKRSAQKTLAGVFPLFVHIATEEQAKVIASSLENEFLKPGGLVTTLVCSGEQWDAPNGWAPLQWVAIQGLRNYGYNELANKIKHRWIRTNLAVYASHHKLVEKYNVDDDDKLGGGGEYPLQDGFGWTNGVLAALLAEDE